MANRLAAFFIPLLIFMIIFPFPILAIDNLHIYINGEDLTESLNPIQEDGQLLVNARSLAESIQAEVKWYQAIKTLILRHNTTEIKIMLDNPYLQINNKTHKINNGLMIKDGHSFIPIKEIVEAFGYLIQKEENEIFIFKPESIVKGIAWQKEGQHLIIEMDKLAPYRILKTDDSKKLIVEIDRASLASDFQDGLSNKNFYLKINRAENMARLQLVIISKYPIPFMLDKGVQENGNKLILNFLPQIMSINWRNNRLEVRANDEIEKPEVTILDDPRRMVIDITDMMLNQFELNLPENEYIKDIRVSQFKYDPVILRIVIELKEGCYLNLEQSDMTESIVLIPTQVTNLKALSCDDHTISFQTDRAVQPDIFTLKEPDRLVINLLNTLRDGAIPDDLVIDGKIVEKIRTARFNEEIVRIVADLTGLTGFSWQENRLPDGCYQYIISLQNTIKKIELIDFEERTDLNISLSSQAEFEVKRLSYPDRIVVDIKNLANNIKEVSLPEPLGLVKDIRISQLSLEPRVIRLVFELEEYYSHSLYSVSPNHIISISLTKEKAVETGNVIVIDAGHGGFDPGAIGPSGMFEKDVNIDLAHRVSNLLKSAGYSVFLTRDDDTFISLKERVTMANEIKAILFVSIHINASSESYSEGTETYLAPEKAGKSSLLATFLQEELVSSLKRVDRGVKEGNLYVIKYTSMPAALVEIAFISNPHEETLLGNDLFKDKAARAIVRGITRYLDKIEQGDE